MLFRFANSPVQILWHLTIPCLIWFEVVSSLPVSCSTEFDSALPFEAIKLASLETALKNDINTFSKVGIQMYAAVIAPAAAATIPGNCETRI